MSDKYKYISVLISYVRYIREGNFRMMCCGERNFFSKEEKIEMLKDYKEKLEKEAKGVNELISKLEKAN